MSALEVESLLQKMAALRERTGDWPLGAGFEFQELYTVLGKIHDKILHAEPLVDSRSSATYSIFIADLRRVAIAVDDALDRFSSSTSFSSRATRRLYHTLRGFHQSGRSRGQEFGARRNVSRLTTLMLLAYPPAFILAQVLVPMLRPLVDQTVELTLRPKIAKQLKEAQRDLEMLLRLFSTYVADLLPEDQQKDDSKTIREESFSPLSGLIGREQDKSNVLNVLTDRETEVVAVVGMAGVGKTALMSEVCRAANSGFDHHLWVHVSQDFDPERIFRALMTSLSEDLQHGEDPESYWWSMKEGLVEKKYLVVLDDVWNEDPRKWNQLLHLLLSKKTPESKIIVTTRIPMAADAIQSARTYKLLPLPIKDSLDLLETPTEAITRKVAERCGGLPKLVHFLKEILKGRAMHSVEVFDRQCMGDNGLLDIAKASYNHLPSHLQRCFMYCSLFPLDHIFDAEEMTCLWVAEGLTHISSREAQASGDLSKLLDECFDIVYESGSRGQMRYKMQFLLHNFARRKGSQYKIIDIEDYTNLIGQSIRYISLIVDKKTEKLPESLIEQKDLRTLILHRSQEMVLCCQRSEIREIPSDYCRYLTALRVLDLHATRIDKLPKSFDMLSDLRYLNLSQTDIAELPKSLGKLQYLIYFNVAQTRIAAVPESIGSIKSLRHVNLSQTCVRELPETIGDLRSLQTLQLSHCNKLVKVPQYIARLTNLQKLDLEGCHYLSEMPQDVRSMKNLKELNILECSSLDRMPFGFSALTKVEALPRYIASFGNEGTILELQGLRNLKILGLQNLERVSHEDTEKKITFSEEKDAEKKLLKGSFKLESLTLHWNIRIENSTAEAEQLHDSMQSNQENISSDMEQQRDGLQPSQEDGISDVEQLIENLEPNEELKKLQIISYRGKRFPNWMTSSLPNLVQIRLVNVKCERLPALGKLPLLAVAEISGMDAIKHVSSELNGENGTFRSLKKLTFSQMFDLESWPQKNGAACPCLEELSIVQCPKFQKLSMGLPVKKLTLWMCPHELLAEGGLAGVTSSLKSLSISLCEELSSESNIAGLMELSSLEDIEISGCDKLESLPSGLVNHASLKSWSVIGCGMPDCTNALA